MRDKDIAIKIENLSKQYRLGVIGTGTLSHDLKRWWTISVLRKEDPYLKIGETNDRASKGKSEYVWALKDINLEIKRGDVVGIIGRNGAGKSTLLKILSRVTKPSTGSIKYNGRIASLLEVGTGFHPEMTGRENIYMNGAIMGMTKVEIIRKLDEIIAFAGVERYIDTPVKRYSSGMTVRLGFSIAAHLEPDILVVDEVLAVGDVEFQKKAIGKMQDVSQGGERTVLFVSHNMGAVKSLCNKGILLQNGSIDKIGYVDDVVDYYLEKNTYLKQQIKTNIDRKGTGHAIFSDFYILNQKNIKVETVLTGEDYTFCFVIKTNQENIKNLDIDFSIHENDDTPLTVNQSSYYNKTYSFTEAGEYCIKFHIPSFYLSPGNKQVRGLLTIKKEIIDWPEFVIGSFNVIMGDFYKSGNLNYNKSIKCLLYGEWEI